jgi:CRISPR-associated protein Cmr3
MTSLGLWLDPLDVLFFRDGRKFDAATRVRSGLPTPQVLAGAVRTALLEQFGCDFRKLGDATRTGKSFADGLDAPLKWIAGVTFRGPWVCRSVKGNRDVLVPAPTALHTGKKGAGGVYRLHPKRVSDVPGWDGDLRPLWLDTRASTEPAKGFIDSAGLGKFLRGEEPDETELHAQSDFFEYDERTGIVIGESTSATVEGEIYSTSLLAPKSGVGFYAEVRLPDGAPQQPFKSVRSLAFGGEGKRVAVSVSLPFAFPDQPVPGANQKRFVLLTTPGVPNARHELDYCGAKLAAVAANSPVAISGWDLARGGPKPTRFAAPAGTVYFLDSADPLPDAPDELGYGCHLQGVWTDG